jgi:hypothetical protein
MIRKINRKTIYNNTIKLNIKERNRFSDYLKRADQVGRTTVDASSSLGKLNCTRHIRIAIRIDLLKNVNELIQKAYDTGISDKEGGAA